MKHNDAGICRFTTSVKQLLPILFLLAACSDGVSSAAVAKAVCSADLKLTAREYALLQAQYAREMDLAIAKSNKGNPGWIDSVLYVNPEPLPPYPERFRQVQARVDSINCEMARYYNSDVNVGAIFVPIPMAELYFVDEQGQRFHESESRYPDSEVRGWREALMSPSQRVTLELTVGWNGDMREVKIVYIDGIERSDLRRLDLASLARQARMRPAMEGGVPNAPLSGAMWDLDGRRNRRTPDVQPEVETNGWGIRTRPLRAN